MNTINSSVSVRPPYAGSTPDGAPSPLLLSLTLREAIMRGQRFNLGAINQSASVAQAEGQRRVVRSELLPTLNSAVGEEFERLNLRTMGVEAMTFPETAKFNYFDARAKMNQSVFDIVKLRNLRSATEILNANRHAVANARDLVVLAVSGSYLQLNATKARIAAAAAQVETSRSIYQQAADRKASGLAARIDVTRSQVQLQTQQQRLRSLQADLDSQKLRLARIIGLPLGQSFDVLEDNRYQPLTGYTVASALEAAERRRPDVQAAAAGVRAAEASLKAAQAERLPNIAVTADFGASGLTPTHQSSGAYTVAGVLTIPIYEGGRIQGDIQQAEAALTQRRTELDDARGQVDQDVRQAFIDLYAAADQVGVAESNAGLAHETLAQSRDRFTAGVADTVELVQSEQAVVQADDDYITAIFAHNLAKVSLARAMGDAEQTVLQFLGMK